MTPLVNLTPETADYETVTNRVDVAHLAFQLRTLKDVQQYCDSSGAAESVGISSATWPLFGVIWPSARVLAARMATESTAIKQNRERVLEVGCGIALASLVLHRSGADVTATDLHPLAEEFLAHNLMLNGLMPMPYAACHWNDTAVQLGSFDLIIASDVLYEPDQPAALAPFVARHAAREARVVLVDPARGNLGKFDRFLAQHGFRLTGRDKAKGLKIVVSEYRRAA